MLYGEKNNEELKPKNNLDNSILTITAVYLEDEEIKKDKQNIEPSVEIPPFETIVKKKNAKKTPLLIVAMVGMIFLLSGAIIITRFNYKITEHSTFSSFNRYGTEEQEALKKTHYLPTDLINQFENVTFYNQNEITIFLFSSADGRSVLFAESPTQDDFSYALDTENVVLKQFIFTGGIEAVMITKNDSITLLWEQHGYFYMLFTDSEDTDLEKIAVSLEKNG